MRPPDMLPEVPPGLLLMARRLVVGHRAAGTPPPCIICTLDFTSWKARREHMRGHGEAKL